MTLTFINSYCLAHIWIGTKGPYGPCFSLVTKMLLQKLWRWKVNTCRPWDLKISSSSESHGDIDRTEAQWGMKKASLEHNSFKWPDGTKIVPNESHKFKHPKQYFRVSQVFCWLSKQTHCSTLQVVETWWYRA